MKRIVKLFAVLAVSFGLMAASASRASAQGMPTIDISNLVQNILGFLDDQMREGSFMDGFIGDVTKMQEIQERYNNMKEKLQDIQNIIAIYNLGAATYNEIEAIVKLNKMIINDAQMFSQIFDYINQAGFDFETVVLAKNIWKGFTNISTVLTKTAGQEMKDFGRFKQSDPLQLLTMLQELTADLYTTYYAIRNYYSGMMSDLYRDRSLLASQGANIFFSQTFWM